MSPEVKATQMKKGKASAPSVAAEDVVLFRPDGTTATVSEIASQLATQKESKASSVQLVTRVLDGMLAAPYNGIVTNSQFREIHTAALKALDRQQGIRPNSLIKEGYIARLRIEGVGFRYAVTQKGGEFWQAHKEGAEAPAEAAEPELTA